MATATLAAAPPCGGAGELSGAVAVLEVFIRTLPHYVPEAAPPRFALMEDGQVFVGGSRSLVVGRLSGDERKKLERRFGEVRKTPGLAGSLRLGPGERRQRLRLFKGGRPLDLTLSGDPAQAPRELQPLASLVQDLERFHHPSLRPFEPSAYALSAREGALRGGCRPWMRSPPVADAVFAPVSVPASAAAGWPTGATPASVCVGERTYVVTFRPLLPGEQP
jgi:hypothetical protein